MDGIGSNVRFNGVTSVVLSKPNELLVADAFNQAIRKVEISTATVSTLLKFTFGYADGTSQ